jgi:hypothetical protein
MSSVDEQDTNYNNKQVIQMLQEVCLGCGWRGEFYPDSTIFASLGGELTCPACRAVKRNRGIESYGRVRILKFNPETVNYYITCPRCSSFYLVGSACQSQSCRKIPFSDRVRRDIEALPPWLSLRKGADLATNGRSDGVGPIKRVKKNIWAGEFMVDISAPRGDVVILYTIIRCGDITVEMTWGSSTGHISAYYTKHPGVSSGVGAEVPELTGLNITRGLARSKISFRGRLNGKKGSNQAADCKTIQGT